MKTRTISCEELGMAVMVSEGTAFTELHRTLLGKRALAEVVEDFGLQPGDLFLDEIEQLPEVLLARYIYPNCLAAVVWSYGFDHRSLTLSEFAEFAELFVEVWLDCVYELNPTWMKGPAILEGGF